jgi:hypothetical protein
MANHTIIAKGKGIRMERIAGGAITPGHLIMLNSDDEFVVHGTARQRAVPIVAIEQELFGRDLDTAYAADELVLGEVCRPGMEVYAVFAAASHTIAIGELLESAGDGTLRELTALTDSSGGTANTTIQDLGGSYTEAEVANNFADVAAALNLGRAGAIAMALEAVGTIAAATRYRVMIL